MTAEYDDLANALYIRLKQGVVERSVSVDDYRVVDLDENGDALGLEILYPADNLEIGPIARDFGFEGRLAEINAAVSDLGLVPVSVTSTVWTTAQASSNAGSWHVETVSTAQPVPNLVVR